MSRSRKKAVAPAKNLSWRVFSYGTGALATLLTRRLIERAWSRVGNSPPPDDPADRRVPWTHALSWAVATGIGVGVGRFVAMRGAAKVWEVATDEPPPVTSST
jgi:hypothetical protein